MDTISPVYARLVLRELERQRIDTAPLLRNMNLSRRELLRGGDIGMQDFLHILRAGDELLGHEQLGFVLGRKMHVFAMGPVGAGMALAPSLREGLQLLESVNRLHATYIDISARSTLAGLTVTIFYDYDTGHLERLHTQTAMMLLQQYMETIIGDRIPDAHYRLALPLPKNQADYREALHGHVSFAAEINEIEIPERWLDLPSPFFDPALWQQAQLSLTRLLKEQSTSDGTPFEQHIAGLLRSSTPPLPDLGEVANRLHVSQRTLNRRLQAESTSFRKLKSIALARWAKQYLRETDDSVEAIAERLGYMDAANFRRAFRKTEGCSPVEYRQSV